MRSGRAAVPAVLAALLLLTGCASSVRPTAAEPTLAGASADAALTRFRDAVEPLARQHAAHGMDYVRALERAGWGRGALQVTADRTSVGLDVPAIQFAARDGRGCLIGQAGGGVLTVRRASPVDGACLIGATRDLG